MGFDRSKLKATSMATVLKQEADNEVKRPSSGSTRPGYLEVKAGDNKFRIFPVHPDSGRNSFAEPKCTSFLTVTKPVRDKNGKVDGNKTELKRGPIFNSKVHGDLPKDLVEEYLRIAKTIAIPELTSDSNEQKKIWNKIVGKEGIKPNDGWIMYAAKITNDGAWEFGLLEVKKSVKTQLTERAMELNANDPTSPDPYSDPNDGICIIINKSGQNLDTEYNVTLDRKQIDKFNTQLIPTEIPDQYLEKWAASPSLAEMFVQTFTRSDFNFQLEGLQRFDQALADQGYPLRIVDRAEFLEVVEELDQLVAPDKDDRNQNGEEEQNPTPTPKLVVSKPTVKTNVFAEKLNKPTVQQSAPKPIVKQQPVQTLPAVQEEEPIVQPEVEVQASQQMSVQDRLAAIRARAGKK